jgi:ADP-ribose pyrophosphatase YjhB (NUDIX family)
MLDNIAVPSPRNAKRGYAAMRTVYSDRMTVESSNGPRVGCGVAILRDRKLLLIRRARPPEAGCWSLPGGKVDLWERTEAAARREIAEELGVRLGALDLLCVVDYVAPEEGEHWVSPVFVAHAFEGEPALLEPEKHTGLGWFALDALPGPLTQSVLATAAELTPP